MFEAVHTCCLIKQFKRSKHHHFQVNIVTKLDRDMGLREELHQLSIRLLRHYERTLTTTRATDVLNIVTTTTTTVLEIAPLAVLDQLLWSLASYWL